MRAYQFALAYLLDLAVGDPRFSPHPVRGFGVAIQFLEKILRGPCGKPGWERFAGVLLALGLPAAVFSLSYWLLYGLFKNLPAIQSLLTVLLAYTTLASVPCTGRPLERTALEAGRVAEARKWLSWIVGRDTENLTREEMIKATLETMGAPTVIAPLFYLLIGGAPLALAFKAASTLDSMVGYKNDRYRNFGWASAGWTTSGILFQGPDHGLADRGGFLDLGLFLAAVPDDLATGRTPIPQPQRRAAQAALAGALQIRLGGPGPLRGSEK